MKTQQCDHAETSSPQSAFRGREALNNPSPFSWEVPRMEGDNFEHKLEVNDLPLRRQTNFMESLILAQDERWRRA